MQNSKAAPQSIPNFPARRPSFLLAFAAMVGLVFTSATPASAAIVKKPKKLLKNAKQKKKATQRPTRKAAKKANLRQPQKRNRPLNTKKLQKRILSEPLKKGKLQADSVTIGLGPTGMMSMLAAVATGHTAVGVEIRREPLRGVHMNIRTDWFNTLAKIDKMMLETYGKDGVPKLKNGEMFKLADVFYNSMRAGGHLDYHELKPGQDQNVAGRLNHVLFTDARDFTRAANGGKAKMYVLPPPKIPEKANPNYTKLDMKKVLDSPSTFQAALINFESMLRDYIGAIEKMDKKAGRSPRLKVYKNHRVAVLDGLSAGYINNGHKRRIVIEEVVATKDKDGRNTRTKKPGTTRIDLGTPTRFALTTGFGGGADAKTLGYQNQDVVYHEGGTSKIAKQHWIAGEVTAHIGGQLIRRVETAVDPKTGKRQTIQQIAVGHEKTPNVAWVPVQVPDFMTFNPIEAGLVPKGTKETSKKYQNAKKKLIREYYVEQVAKTVHLSPSQIKKMRMFYGPNLFTLSQKLGDNARIAQNGSVAGDLMGNGHFLTSGGAMTGMIGHANRFIEYWQAVKSGGSERLAAQRLHRGIKKDSEAWLAVSKKEFFDVLPVNFGKESATSLNLSKGKPDDVFPASAAHGLGKVLGQGNWADSFKRLQRGEFGTATTELRRAKKGERFYVPKEQLKIVEMGLKQGDVTVHMIGGAK